MATPPAERRRLASLDPLVLAAGIVALAPFVLWPRLDLVISAAFVGADGRFVGVDSGPLASVMDAITIGSRLFAVLLLAVTVLAWLPLAAPALAPLRTRRVGLLFVLAVLALGPGLIVNTLLKDHSGRARPITTAEFGGPHRFSAPFTIADQCPGNCSFVSGHAAFATMPVAGAFLAASRGRRRAWLAGGFATGLLVGLGRIVSGAHYASDVLAAILIVYLVAAGCAAWLPRNRR